MGSDLDITVVVMAFNEASTLGAVVQEIDSTLRELRRAYEIVIVDDGSADGTGPLAEQMARVLTEVRVIHHELNRGLGEVYRTGFKNARGRFVSFFPADGQYPAVIVKQFLPLMGRADMVLGYLPERKGALMARGLSMAERVLYKLLLGPVPRSQGVMMFRRTLLDEIELKSTGRGWAVLRELTIRASRGDYRLVGVPIGMRPRMSGKSKVNNLRTIWANAKQAFALRRHLREVR